MINVKIDSASRKVVVNLLKFKKINKIAIKKSFMSIGKDLKSMSNKLILDKNKTGRIYLVRLRGALKRHQSSAAGESPANLTGNLRKKLFWKTRGNSELIFGDNAQYAGYLELGTDKKPHKMAKRPYLIKSIKDNQRNIERHFIRNIKKGFKA